MAFCGRCGQKNPDDANFCSACGSPLAAPVDQTPSESQETSPKSERIILHRDSASPSSPRRDNTSQHSRQERNREEAPRRNKVYKKPKKKGGNFGGCLKKLLLWLCGIVVVLGLLLWCIGSFMGDSDGGDNGGNSGGDQQSSVPFERVTNQHSLDSLTNAKKFKKNNGDVVVRAGRYEGRSFGETITFDVDSTPDGKIAGKLHVQMGGETIRTCVFAYCGNGIYAMYNGESIYDDPDEYFQAMADHETIEWSTHGTVTVTYTGPCP